MNLNADLVGLGGSDLDVLNGEVLAGLPGDGSLAGDGLCSFCAGQFLIHCFGHEVRHRHSAGPMEG